MGGRGGGGGRGGEEEEGIWIRRTKALRCVTFKLGAVNSVEKNSKEATARAMCINRGRSRIKAGLVYGPGRKRPGRKK